jgi:hypothetical protein
MSHFNVGLREEVNGKEDSDNQGGLWKVSGQIEYAAEHVTAVIVVWKNKMDCSHWCRYRIQFTNRHFRHSLLGGSGLDIVYHPERARNAVTVQGAAKGMNDADGAPKHSWRIATATTSRRDILNSSIRSHGRCNGAVNVTLSGWWAFDTRFAVPVNKMLGVSHAGG